MALLLAEELLPSAPENHSYHITYLYYYYYFRVGGGLSYLV